MLLLSPSFLPIIPYGLQPRFAGQLDDNSHVDEDVEGS